MVARVIERMFPSMPAAVDRLAGRDVADQVGAVALADHALLEVLVVVVEPDQQAPKLSR
jgi:hypothetical protein